MISCEQGTSGYIILELKLPPEAFKSFKYFSAKQEQGFCSIGLNVSSMSTDLLHQPRLDLEAYVQFSRENLPCNAFTHQSCLVHQAFHGTEIIGSIRYLQLKVFLYVGISFCKNLDTAASLRVLEPIRDRIQRLHIDCVWEREDAHGFDDLGQVNANDYGNGVFALNWNGDDGGAAVWTWGLRGAGTFGGLLEPDLEHGGLLVVCVEWKHGHEAGRDLLHWPQDCAQSRRFLPL